jgi:hypothetical protein
MSNFSTDEDLLKYEPRLFVVEQHPSQKLGAGANGAISHSTATVKFNSATGDFVNAGLTSGHVIYLFKSSGTVLYFDQAVPVASVLNATTLTLRAKAVPMQSCSGITWRVSTFDQQHENLKFELMQHYSMDDSDLDTENDEADLYNRRQLRDVATFGALEAVYFGQAKSPDDGNWAKASGYRLKYDAALSRTKLQFDADADSDPDRTMRGGSVKLVVGGQGDKWPTKDWTKAEDIDSDR